jgi:hypothetical protein
MYSQSGYKASFKELKIRELHLIYKNRVKLAGCPAEQGSHRLIPRMMGLYLIYLISTQKEILHELARRLSLNKTLFLFLQASPSKHCFFLREEEKVETAPL